MPILKDYDYLLHYAKTLTKDANVLNELIQDTLITCWEKEKTDEAKSYCKKVLFSKFIDTKRAAARWKNKRVVWIDDKDFAADIVEKNNGEKIIAEALKFLDGKVKNTTVDAFLLHYYFEIPYRKVAKMIGVKDANTVAQRFVNVKKILSQMTKNKTQYCAVT